MSRYAKINLNNIVENVIVCEDSQISLQDGYFVKVTTETKNAQIGGEYNKESNKFILIKPHESWILDEDFNWTSPVEIPSNAQLTPLDAVINYFWNEENQEWVSRSSE